MLSSRRRTVNGRITRPYSLCLKGPRRRSATLLMKLARFVANDILSRRVPPALDTLRGMILHRVVGRHG